MRAWGSAGVLFAVGFATALPQPANAGPSQPNYPFHFKVPASGAYKAEVHAAPGGRLELVTRRGLPGGGSIGAAYSVKGRVTKKVMRGDFGRLGRVAVRVKPTGDLVADTQCKHNYTYVVREATYRGKVRFRSGYTSIRSRRLRPTIAAPDPVMCGLTLDRFKKSATRLQANSRTPQTILQFERGSATAPTFAVVYRRQQMGKVTVWHYISAVLPTSAFDFDLALSSADLQDMSAPFSGTAHFQAGPSGPPAGALTGDLRATLADGSVALLAGPSFAATLESYYLSD